MVCASKAQGLHTQVLILVLLFPLTVSSINFNSNSNGSYLADIRLPDHPFSTDCNFGSSSSPDYNTHSLFEHQLQNRSLRLHLRHPLPPHDGDDKPQKKCDSILESALRDLNRIHTFRRRITETKNPNPRSGGGGGSGGSSSTANARHLLEQRKQKRSDETVIQDQRQLIMGTLKSGVTLGSGEYLMDVYIGTPPRKFSLIVDTGSDLNWIQCVPCYDCFQQDGSYYDPLLSSSFKNISCRDPRCRLVSSPDPPGRPCGANSSGKNNQSSCPYFYWYGDSSNTTGDFALETFTVNLTGGGRGSELRKVKDVMFGCGHWNRGLFHGAAGLLGLGRGPLSFATQLQSLYGHSFSYCLVDRYSDYNITSKLIFGEDKELLNHPQLNFTSLIDSPARAGNTTDGVSNSTATGSATTNPAATFYYVQIKSVLIDGQILGNIPEETWRISDEDGTGGTIVDSGTTLSYFTKPAHDVIRDAFIKRVSQRYHNYPLVKDFPVLDPCYNVSGVRDVEFPDFGILFEDGGFWNFPAENNFIWISDEVVCLAILGAGKQDFSIIGNYQQQNFHVLYDIQGSKLGFAPRRCSDV